MTNTIVTHTTTYNLLDLPQQETVGSTIVIDRKYASDGTVMQVNHYYPYGGLIIDPRHTISSTNASDSRYRFTGKELSEESGEYDFGARYLDPIPGRFTTIDPLAEKYYSLSPFAYCAGNPSNSYDPTGMSPVYDPDGNFLGTDDNGLQGEAIVMSPKNFIQGMSYKEAMSFSTKTNGTEADERIKNHMENLPTRPDWDGYLTLKEANEWYRTGNGEPLFVSLDKIDLSGIVSLGEKFVGQVKSFNLLFVSNSINDGLVYGHVTLKRYPNNTVRAFADNYSFEMHNWKNPSNWGRNAETVIGNRVAGEGTRYEINVYGSKRIKPILPWIK